METQPGERMEEGHRCPQCGNTINPRAAICAHCGATLQPTTGSQSNVVVGGLQSNTAAALCYLLTWVTGLIFLLTTKDDEFVRFHAKQAIVVGVAAIGLVIATVTVATIFLRIFWFASALATALTTLLWLAISVGIFALVIFLMVNAYQGKRFTLPVLGNIAEKWQV